MTTFFNYVVVTERSEFLAAWLIGFQTRRNNSMNTVWGVSWKRGEGEGAKATNMRCFNLFY